jgi:hypothetical protein
MYDYAKAYQSVCGYDFVLLDKPRCSTYMDSMRAVADVELTNRLGTEGLHHLKTVTGACPCQPALRACLRACLPACAGRQSLASAGRHLVISVAISIANERHCGVCSEPLLLTDSVRDRQRLPSRASDLLFGRSFLWPLLSFL